MAKNLVQLFKSDPAGKLERLRDKLLAAEATFASAESERAILSAEVHSGELDRKELDRVNERHERASRLVAELKAAIVAAEQQLAAKRLADADAAEAEINAKVRALGDERQALMDAISGDVEHLIAKLARACDVGREIAGLRGSGQHTAEIAPGSVQSRVLGYVQKRLDVEADPMILPPKPLVEMFATGEQIAEMASRKSPKAAPVFATLTNESGRHAVRLR